MPRVCVRLAATIFAVHQSAARSAALPTDSDASPRLEGRMPAMASADQMTVDGRCLFRIHASAVIREAAGRVLLVQEEKAGSRAKWNLPGGHVDHVADGHQR